MRVGIAGYGKMGVLVWQVALSRGHEVPVIIDPSSSAKEVTQKKINSTTPQLDVIIDFTNPDVVLDNIKSYCELKIPAVIGTTGWYDQIDQVAENVKNSAIGLIWSGNFSLGVNLFFHIIKTTGKLMNRFSQYDVMINEYHHRHKADSPSGTAQMIGDILIDQIDRKNNVFNGFLERRIKDSELQITSTRGGSIPGTHRVTFDSEVDSLVLEHSARSRAGFAEGAVMAAEWVHNQRGFFNIDDMMDSIIKGNNTWR